MKIVQVIPYFNPIYGGEVNVCYNLSANLARRGHKVTILTSDLRYDEEFARHLERVEVIPFGTKAKVGLISYTPSIKRWMKENADDQSLFHLHAFRTYQNIAVTGSLRRIDVPYLIQAHGSLPRIAGKDISKRMFDELWGDRILRSASRFIALNDREEMQYVGLGLEPSRVRIIPNAIDLAKYEPLPRRGMFREEHGIDDGTKLVLFLGRFNAIKGIELLLEAFALLVKRLEGVKLLMIGPNDGFLERTNQIVKELGLDRRVVILGYISDKKKVMSAYVDSDLFVLPSIYDMFPTTVLEAWACEKPVIVSEGCGISGMVNGAGLVVRRTASDLSDAMQRVLTDDPLSTSMGKEGRRMVIGRFSWDSVADQFERTYNEIIRS